MLKLRRELYGKKGLILLDSALIAESKMTYLCNNNIILVNSNKEMQLKRLEEKLYSEEQITQRINSQYSYDLKLNYIEDCIHKDGHGSVLKFDSDKNEADSLFNQLTSNFIQIQEKI